MNEKLKAALASYARSVLAAASALYLAGVTDPADLAKALLAGILPVALRALNKKDPAFGIVAQVAQPYIAKLQNGEPVIPKEYTDTLEKLTKQAIDASSKNPAAKSATTAAAAAKKAPAKKATPPKK